MNRATASQHDRLQPALLDRLLDDQPQQPAEAAEQHLLTHAALRKAMQRDLAWLLNATQLQPDWDRSEPVLAASVLHFGLPPLAGVRASQVQSGQLEEAIALAIRRFEPRLRADSLVVRAIEPGQLLDTHNRIEFEISAELWAQPLPLDVLLRTCIDLEGGRVEVLDVGAAGRRSGVAVS